MSTRQSATVANRMRLPSDPKVALGTAIDQRTVAQPMNSAMSRGFFRRIPCIKNTNEPTMIAGNRTTPKNV